MITIGKFTIRPEIEKPMYWLHLGVIAVIVLAILEYSTGGKMLTVSNVLWSIPLLGIGDIVAHTLLKLN